MNRDAEFVSRAGNQRNVINMIKTEFYIIKDAKVIESEFFIQKNQDLFNRAVELTMDNKIDFQNKEKGILLCLESTKTKRKYERFMTKTSIKELIGNLDIDLKDEHLDFFAEKLRSRKTQIQISIVENDEDEKTFMKDE